MLHLIIELLSSLPPSVLPLPSTLSLPFPLFFAKLGLGWLARTRGGGGSGLGGNGGLCLEDPITALNGFLDTFPHRHPLFLLNPLHQDRSFYIVKCTPVS